MTPPLCRCGTCACPPPGTPRCRPTTSYVEGRSIPKQLQTWFSYKPGWCDDHGSRDEYHELKLKGEVPTHKELAIAAGQWNQGDGSLDKAPRANARGDADEDDKKARADASSEQSWRTHHGLDAEDNTEPRRERVATGSDKDASVAPASSLPIAQPPPPERADHFWLYYTASIIAAVAASNLLQQKYLDWKRRAECLYRRRSGGAENPWHIFAS